MSLFQESMESFQLIEKRSFSDGEGGLITTWVESAEFKAAVTTDQTLQARVAEKEGVTSLYTITCAPGAVLSYHDVCKRLSDGQIFRVTSNGKDKTTPEGASFQFSQVTAEKWELTV